MIVRWHASRSDFNSSGQVALLALLEMKEPRHGIEDVILEGLHGEAAGLLAGRMTANAVRHQQQAPCEPPNRRV